MNNLELFKFQNICYLLIIEWKYIPSFYYLNQQQKFKHLDSIPSSTSMQVLLLIILLTCIPSTNQGPTRQYLVTSGRLNFGQTVRNKSVTIPIIPNPIILYSISTIRIMGFFSYSSNHTLTPAPNNKSLLTITIQVSKVSFYQIILGYLVIQSMPHIEDGIVKLTMEQNIIKFKSKKKIIRNNDLNVAAHLMGFSSSKIARENFFYASVFDYNYQIWTSAQLSPVDYLIIHFLIIDVNYENNDTICLGSFIYSNSKAHNILSPYHVEINNTLQILLGLEAFNLPNADFSFNPQTKEVSMPSTGAYSFSIIALNTTCQRILATDTYFDGKNEKIYNTVFIVFLVLTLIVIVGLGAVWVWRCVKGRKAGRLEGEYNVTVEDRLGDQGETNKRKAVVAGSEKNLLKKEKRIQNELDEAPSTEGRISNSQNKVIIQKKKKKVKISEQPQKQ